MFCWRRKCMKSINCNHHVSTWMYKAETFTANCNREIIGAKAAASYFSLLHCLSVGFWIVPLQNSVYIPYIIDRFNFFMQLFCSRLLNCFMGRKQEHIFNCLEKEGFCVKYEFRWNSEKLGDITHAIKLNKRLYYVFYIIKRMCL